jgi:hypothetical protein
LEVSIMRAFKAIAVEVKANPVWSKVKQKVLQGDFPRTGLFALDSFG